MEFNFRGTIITNDGWKLLTIPFYSEAKLQDMQAQLKVLDNFEDFEDLTEMDKKSYFSLFEGLQKQFPLATLPYITKALDMAKHRNFDYARDIILSLLERKRNKYYDYLIYATLSWIYLLEDYEHLEEAIHYSKLAYKKNRHSPISISIRGYILIEAGKVKKGIRLLKKVSNTRKPVGEKRNNPETFIYLAYGYYLKKDKRRCLRYLTPLMEYLPKMDQDEKYIYDRISQRTGNFGGIIEPN